MTYRRLLLATDLSEGSTDAARAAAALLNADGHGAAITVVTPPDLPRRAPREVHDELLDAARRQASDTRLVLLEWLKTRGLTGFDAVVREGSAAAAIADEARARAAQCVVVGSHGHGRIERVLLGSVARGVLHRATADVLVARAVPEDARYQNILVATDLHAPSAHAARRARSIAERHGARVALVHAVDPGEWGPARGAAWLSDNVLEGLRAFAREHFEGHAEQVVVHGRAVAALLDEAARRRADLVVVGTHGAGRVERAILGSVAEAIAERAACSVLVARG